MRFCKFLSSFSTPRNLQHWQMHNLLSYFAQSLQRRLDMERADREKAENETLKLVNELQENNRKADGLRDMEMKFVSFPFHAYYISFPYL